MASTSSTFPVKMDEALRAQFDRLGFTFHGEPAFDAAGAHLDEKVRWLAHLRPPEGVWRGPQSGDVRGLRFCVPWPAPRAVVKDHVVVGVCPGHWLTVPSDSVRGVTFLGAPGIFSLPDAPATLQAFLEQLEPDVDFPAARPVAQSMALPPALETAVLWALADAGICDVAPGRVPLHVLGELTALRLMGANSLEGLDERFANLDALQVSASSLSDLAPLTHLPRLRRLMLAGCVLGDLNILERLPLEELHLPHCGLQRAQLGFLQSMPALRAVTVSGNRLTTEDAAFVDALPPGLDPRGTHEDALAFNAWLKEHGIVAGGVVEGGRGTFALPREGGMWSTHLPWTRGLAGVEASTRLAQALRSPRPGVSMVTPVAAWPASRRGDPASLRVVPREVVEQLERLGVTLEPVTRPEVFPTATTRVLARARWPQAAWKTARGAPLEMSDFRGAPLHVLPEVGPNAWSFGKHASDRLVLMVADDGTADPTVYVVDPRMREQPRYAARLPLSEFLSSLQRVPSD